MKKSAIIASLLWLLGLGQYAYAQDYPFVPKDLKLLSMDELYSNPPPSHVDLVYYEDGKKTTFRKAMTKIESGKYIPHVFVNDKKEYKVLVLAKPKKGEKQGTDQGMAELDAESAAKVYPFVPKDLKLLSMDELYSNPQPSHVDLVYYEDGTKTTFQKAMKKIVSQEYHPYLFVNDKKEYKAMVLKKIEGGRKSKVLDLMGQQARPFSCTDLKGNHFSLDGLKGKVIVLNFWFINCAPCVEEIPALNQLVKEYADNENVVFIGLALDNQKQLKRFLKKKKFDYHIIPDSDDIGNRYGIESYPTHLIIDPSSKVDYSCEGDVPTFLLKESIDSCLERL